MKSSPRCVSHGAAAAAACCCGGKETSPHVSLSFVWTGCDESGSSIAAAGSTGRSMQNLQTTGCARAIAFFVTWILLYRCRLTACSAFPAPKTVNQIRRRDRRCTFRRIGYNGHDSPGRAFTDMHHQLVVDDAGPMQFAAGYVVLAWKASKPSFDCAAKALFFSFFPFCGGSTSRGMCRIADHQSRGGSSWPRVRVKGSS